MKYLFIAVLMMLIVPLTASADMLQENHHVVDSCVMIDNLSEFPDYDFFISGAWKFPTSTVLEDGWNCDMNGSGKLGAIKKSDWDSVIYSDDPEQYGNWPNMEENTDLVIWSDLQFSFLGQVPDNDPTSKVNQIVHINSLTPDSVGADLIKTETENLDGTTMIDASETGQKIPYTSIVIVIAGLAGLWMLYRLWKK